MRVSGIPYIQGRNSYSDAGTTVYAGTWMLLARQ
jgi:hypothetical protein